MSGEIYQGCSEPGETADNLTNDRSNIPEDLEVSNPIEIKFNGDNLCKGIKIDVIKGEKIGYTIYAFYDAALIETKVIEKKSFFNKMFKKQISPGYKFLERLYAALKGDENKFNISPATYISFDYDPCLNSKDGRDQPIFFDLKEAKKNKPGGRGVYFVTNPDGKPISLKSNIVEELCGKDTGGTTKSHVHLFFNIKDLFEVPKFINLIDPSKVSKFITSDNIGELNGNLKFLNHKGIVVNLILEKPLQLNVKEHKNWPDRPDFISKKNFEDLFKKFTPQVNPSEIAPQVNPSEIQSATGGKRSRKKRRNKKRRTYRK